MDAAWFEQRILADVIVLLNSVHLTKESSEKGVSAEGLSFRGVCVCVCVWGGVGWGCLDC